VTPDSFFFHSKLHRYELERSFLVFLPRFLLLAALRRSCALLFMRSSTAAQFASSSSSSLPFLLGTLFRISTKGIVGADRSSSALLRALLLSLPGPPPEPWLDLQHLFPLHVLHPEHNFVERSKYSRRLLITSCSATSFPPFERVEPHDAAQRDSHCAFSSTTRSSSWPTSTEW
jgi:hypothetical protein